MQCKYTVKKEFKIAIGNAGNINEELHIEQVVQNSLRILPKGTNNRQMAAFKAGR